MTSQLRHYFQASQAVHGADDVTTPQEPGQFLGCLWSEVDTFNYFTTVGRSAQPC